MEDPSGSLKLFHKNYSCERECSMIIHMLPTPCVSCGKEVPLWLQIDCSPRSLYKAVLSESLFNSHIQLLFTNWLLVNFQGRRRKTVPKLDVKGNWNGEIGNFIRSPCSFPSLVANSYVRWLSFRSNSIFGNNKAKSRLRDNDVR